MRSNSSAISFHEAYNKLNSKFSDSNVDEFPHYVYLIIPQPERKPTFEQFVKQILYVGVGVFTRTFDHILLARLYQECIDYIKQLCCEDKKFEKILNMMTKGSRKALLIRIQTNNRSKSKCFECGTINAIG